MLPVLLAFALAVGCGGHGQRSATTKPAGSVPVSGGAGGWVSVGGGRSLYLECVGSGTPPVVLEAGFGGNTLNWSDVQPELGRTTRTCAYDRAGLGHSPPMPGVHDAQDEIDDLQRLLLAAHIEPPYVLVGHSYGGILARLFASQHPGEAAGVVLVDARGCDATRRQVARLPKSQVPPALSAPVQDGVDVAASEALASRVRSLGATPLAVITASRHDQDWGRVLSPTFARAFDRLWATMQDELTALSSNHLHVVALRSDHFVQRVDGQPNVVIHAVQAVVRAACDHTPVFRHASNYSAARTLAAATSRNGCVVPRRPACTTSSVPRAKASSPQCRHARTGIRHGR
jgi:pimeloyl-ACP methyl ester carboxylesterase